MHPSHAFFLCMYANNTFCAAVLATLSEQTSAKFICVTRHKAIPVYNLLVVYLVLHFNAVELVFSDSCDQKTLAMCEQSFNVQTASIDCPPHRKDAYAIRTLVWVQSYLLKRDTADVIALFVLTLPKAFASLVLGKGPNTILL